MGLDIGKMEKYRSTLFKISSKISIPFLILRENCSIWIDIG